VIYNALLLVAFLATFIVFAANVIRSFSKGSVEARTILVDRSEHPIAFAIATITSIFFVVVSLVMVLIIGSHLLGIEI
jgi:hypothetical protein